MNQTGTFMLVIFGLVISFYVMGVPMNNPLLETLLHPQNISTSTLWSLTILGAFSAAATVTLGLLYKDLERSVMAFLMPILATFLFNIVEIFLRIAEFNYIIAILLFGPVMFYMIWLLVDYWRGRD